MGLSDKQKELNELLVRVDPGPEEEPGLAKLLRDTIEGGLPSQMLTRPGEKLTATKYDIEQVLACEAGYVARRQEEDFAWTPATMRGTIVHRALERSILGRESPLASELVEDAVGYFISQKGEQYAKPGLAEALQLLSPEHRHDLVRDTTDLVEKFLLDWPTIGKTERPRTETKITVRLLEGKLALSGRVDLVLGGAQGSLRGSRIIDFKTGTPSIRHWDEIAFYALLETIARSVAPQKVAVYYPESGDVQVKVVTRDLLENEAHRVTQALWHLYRANTLPLVELSENLNPACQWCPRTESCGTYRAANPAADVSA